VKKIIHFVNSKLGIKLMKIIIFIILI